MGQKAAVKTKARQREQRLNIQGRRRAVRVGGKSKTAISKLQSPRDQAIRDVRRAYEAAVEKAHVAYTPAVLGLK